MCWELQDWQWRTIVAEYSKVRIKLHIEDWDYTKKPKFLYSDWSNSISIFNVYSDKLRGRSDNVFIFSADETNKFYDRIYFLLSVIITV